MWGEEESDHEWSEGDNKDPDDTSEGKRWPLLAHFRQVWVHFGLRLGQYGLECSKPQPGLALKLP